MINDTHHPNSTDGSAAAREPKIFPDLATCRVKQASFGDYMECQNIWGSACPHGLIFASIRFCRHATRLEILARTEQAQLKSPA